MRDAYTEIKERVRSASYEQADAYVNELMKETGVENHGWLVERIRAVAGYFREQLEEEGRRNSRLASDRLTLRELLKQMAERRADAEVGWAEERERAQQKSDELVVALGKLESLQTQYDELLGWVRQSLAHADQRIGAGYAKLAQLECTDAAQGPKAPFFGCCGATLGTVPQPAPKPTGLDPRNVTFGILTDNPINGPDPVHEPKAEPPLGFIPLRDFIDILEGYLEQDKRG